MKKLIAISVILVLLAGAAFAETTFGATVMAVARLAQGTTQEGPDGADVKEDFRLSRLRLDATTSNDEGTFGGYIRFQPAGLGDSFPDSWSDGVSGHAWWKPIDAVKVQLGTDPDGRWDPTNIVGYGFWEAASAWAVGFIPEGGSYFGGSSFYGGFGDGLSLTITPLDALTVNIGIPLTLNPTNKDDKMGVVKNAYLSSHIQVAYAIDGIGTATVTYKGGAGHQDWEAPKSGKYDVYNKPFDSASPTTTGAASGVKTPGYGITPEKLEDNDPGSIFVSFDLSAIENLGLNFGVGYTLGYKNDGKGTYDRVDADGNPDVDGRIITNVKKNELKNDDWKTSGTLAVGVGVSYNITDEFGLKFRAQAANILGGGKNEFTTTATDTVQGAPAGLAYSKESKESIKIGVDLLPSYAVSEAFKIFLAVGARFNTADVTTEKGSMSGQSQTQTTTKNSTLDWYAQPYITYSQGPGTFYFGFRLDGKGERSGEVKSEATSQTTETVKSVGSLSYINWSIPIGFAISF